MLRPYQSAIVERLHDAVGRGVRRPLVVAPTGSGKTVIAQAITERAVARGRRVLFVVHREELLEQTLGKLEAVGVRSSVAMGSDRRVDETAPVVVASIQTLARRKHYRPAADVVFFDEAHLSLADSWREVANAYASSVVIGMTATPWRTDGRGFSDAYDEIFVVAYVDELIEAGHLAAFDAFAYDAPALHDVPLSMGDYQSKELELACNTRVLVGDIVAQYRTHAHKRPAIVFPVSVEHSKSIVAEFAAAGYVARHLDWQTPGDERKRLIADFRAGLVDALSSVGVLTEGFDAPVAEVCILARPTKSLALALQMMGRVLRPHANKRRALVHDHAGVLLRHGLPDERRVYSLAESVQAAPRLLVCTDCGLGVRSFPSSGLCPSCGSLQNLPAEVREASDRRRGKQTVDGVRLDRAAILRIREQFAARGKAISREHAERIANATRDEKAGEFLRLVEVARVRGFQRGWVGHQFRAVFGVWPRFKDEELAASKPALYPFLPSSALTPIPRSPPCSSPKNPTCNASSEPASRCFPASFGTRSASASENFPPACEPLSGVQTSASPTEESDPFDSVSTVLRTLPGSYVVGDSSSSN